MPETQTTPETQVPATNSEIATINGKHYFKHSMSTEQVGAFDQAIEISNKIEAFKIDIRDAQYARQYLINFIESEAGTMEEYIPEPEVNSEDAETDTEIEAEATA